MIDSVQKSYLACSSDAKRFGERIQEKLNHLIFEAQIGLPVPVQMRIKEWESIEEKINRKELQITDCKELRDLVGLRVILLFRRDVYQVCELIEKKFKVLWKSDKEAECESDHFGYASMHFGVGMPSDWRGAPTLKSVIDFPAEIQVRTLAQHLWADASHWLQYKREQDVPHPVRRAIHRVAALLETSDLEFERVLEKRDEYQQRMPEESEFTPLNIDSLNRILDEKIVAEKKKRYLASSDVLEDLIQFKVLTVKDLKDLIDRHLMVAISKCPPRHDRLRVRGNTAKSYEIVFSYPRIVRMMLELQFDAEWTLYYARKLTNSFYQNQKKMNRGNAAKIA